MCHCRFVYYIFLLCTAGIASVNFVHVFVPTSENSLENFRCAARLFALPNRIFMQIKTVITFVFLRGDSTKPPFLLPLRRSVIIFTFIIFSGRFFRENLQFRCESRNCHVRGLGNLSRPDENSGGNPRKSAALSLVVRLAFSVRGVFEFSAFFCRKARLCYAESYVFEIFRRLAMCKIS